MPKAIQLVLVALLAFLAGLTGIFFFSGQPVSTNLEIISHVRRGNTEVLENHFTSMIAQYRENSNTELALMRKYESFANSDPVFESQLKAWHNAFPESIAAKLALGKFYSHLGWLSRGSQYISKTHPNQIKAMNQYCGMASD